MADPLEDFIRRIRDDTILPQSREEATRQGVVLPILARLGWDRDNLQEVVPEFDVGDGTRVDYCLKLRGKNAVFIEVKRTGETLDPHQEQLLKYAFQHGVEIAVLTDGLLWWIYLPLLSGSWEQRRVFAIDIRQQSDADAAERFYEFLGRDAVSSGEAVRVAQQLHVSLEKTRQIALTLPEAWKQLYEEPDQQLVDLLADKVEGICGHRPDDQAIAEFLSRAARGTFATTRTRAETADGAQRVRRPVKGSAPPSGTPDDGRTYVTAGQFEHTGSGIYHLQENHGIVLDAHLSLRELEAQMRSQGLESRNINGFRWYLRRRAGLLGGG